MITASTVRDPRRVAILLSLFSAQTRDGILSAIANDPLRVRGELENLTASSAPIPELLSLADRADLDILVDFLRGVTAAISADMGLSAFDRSRASRILSFYGIQPESFPSDDSLKGALESPALQRLRAINTAVSGVTYRPAAIFAWFLLLGRTIGDAQKMQSLMAEPAVTAALREKGEPSDAELGDAVLIDAAREQADAMDIPLPEMGQVMEGAALAGTHGVKLTAAAIRQNRRARRRKRARRALQRMSAVQKAIAAGNESTDGRERELAANAEEALAQHETPRSAVAAAPPSQRSDASDSTESDAEIQNYLAANDEDNY